MNLASFRITRGSPALPKAPAFDANGELKALIAKARVLAKGAASADPWITAPALFVLEQSISDRIHALQGPILGKVVAWNDADEAFALWAREATQLMADAAAQFATRSEDSCKGDERKGVLQRLIMLALVNRGDATKWETITQGVPAHVGGAALHGLYRLAERIGQAQVVEILKRGGVSQGLTIEAHYLRVLMLPLLCHGLLNRQQIEIADSWLWTWTPSYRLATANERSEAGLWVDLAGDGALRTPNFSPEGMDVRHAIVTALKTQLAEVVAAFHSGVIYPGFGCSSEFRVDEHIAVLDYVQRIWERVQPVHSRRRSERIQREATPIEAFVGLGEFMDRGFGPKANLLEATRRWFRVNDESDHGLGLFVDEMQWEQLQVGDLVGVKAMADAYPILGVAVRKLPARGDHECLLGVEILGRDPRRVSLKSAQKQFECVYLPGKDPSGSLDTILVAEGVFADKANFELVLDQQTYVIELNRMRRQGRGWVVAGFEIIGVVERSAPVAGTH
jgi:hypothetical protein